MNEWSNVMVYNIQLKKENGEWEREKNNVEFRGEQN